MLSMMTHPFYKLGRIAAPHLAKAKWLLEASAGTKEGRIQAEYVAGLHLANAYRKEAPRDDDPATLRLLERIGGRLTTRLKNKQRRFAFTGTLTPETNALALPGGFIFISRPLLELCAFQPDEVAFILAHETGHVVLQHTFKRYMTSSAVGLAQRAVRVRSPAVQAAGVLARDLLGKGYSRTQEFDADRFGYRLCEAAGFDPQAGARMLERLHALASQPEGLDRYFATHPPLEERVGKLAQRDTANRQS